MSGDDAYQLKNLTSDVFVFDAPNWCGDPNQDTLKIGLNKRSIRAHAEYGLSFLLGQLYGVVGPGLIRAEHVFRGLRRDMRVKDDAGAAASKFAVTWAAKRDAELVSDGGSHYLRWITPEPSRVFVVYISPNLMLGKFPSIYGWLEHWAWLPADPVLAGAPVDWLTRYDEKIWSAP